MNHPVKKLAATIAFLYALIAHSGCGSYDVSPQDGGLRRTSGFSMGLSPQGGTVTAGSGMTTGALQVATGPQAIGNYAGAGPCGAGSAVTAIGSNGAITCGTAGVTNSAGSNVIPVSTGSGSGFVASGETDDGTTFGSPSREWVIGGGTHFSSGSLYTFNYSGATKTTGLVVNMTGNFTGFEQLPLMAICQTCTVDTTAQPISMWGVNIELYPTHTGGSSAFSLVGLHIKAAITSAGSGDSAQAIYVEPAGGIINDQNGASLGPSNFISTANVVTTLTTGAVGSPTFTVDGATGNTRLSNGAITQHATPIASTNVFGDLTMFGDPASTGNNAYFSSNSLNGAWDSNANDHLLINRDGYHNSNTRKRDTLIYDGEEALLAKFDGVNELLDMTSHKIANLTDPSSAQDAVTLHYLNVNGYTSTSGMTAGHSVRAITSSTIGIGAFTDDGTNATINGVLTAAGNLVSTTGTTTFGNVRGVIISPTLAAGTTNDWAPTGYATSENFYVSCNAGNCTLTGLQGGADGRHIRIVNTGSSMLSIPNASGLSSAGNQFNNSIYGGTVNLVANQGCEVDYVFSTAVNFWTQTGYSCFPFADDGVTLTTPRNITTPGSISTTSSGTIVSNSFMQAGTEVYGNGGAEYLTGTGGNGLGFLYSTNAAGTGFINSVGYQEGTTQPRSLWVQDGQGSSSAHSIAQFDGSTHDTTFPNGNVISHARFIASSSSGTSPMVDFKQAGQTEWQMYQIGSTNGLSLWNSTAAVDVTTWASDGTLTQAKGATFASPTLSYSFANQPIGGMGAYAGTHVEQVDEWCGAVSGTLATASTIGTGYVLQFSGTGAGLTTFTHSNGHPCELAMGTGTATSGQGISVVSQGGFGTSDGNYTWEATVRWPTLSSTSNAVATEYVSELGFLDTPQNKTQGNGFFFMYDKGNFAGGTNSGNVDALQCVSRESGGGTQTAYLINNTGNSDETFPLGVGTVVANTWYRLKIVVTGTTRAEFYRDAGSGYVKVCDINTHMPTGFGTGFVTMSNAASGTGARSLEVDQSRWAADLTSVRSP